MSGASFTPGPSRRRRCIWGVYVILDAAIAKRPHLEVARQVLSAGARVIQLRDKFSTFEELIEIGRELRRMTYEHDATFIVNDNPYLAREVDADGVHLGQTDFATDIAREILGPDKLVGLSTHNKQQALAAQLLPVDYIGVGPVYPTRSKESEWPVVGTNLIRWVKQSVSLPMVAIGGITEERVTDCVLAGADNVAMIGELMCAENIEDKTRRVIQAFERAKAL